MYSSLNFITKFIPSCISHLQVFKLTHSKLNTSKLETYIKFQFLPQKEHMVSIIRRMS